MTTHSIDLRSDTVTLPDEGMRRAMAAAELGDDVIDIDPTVERFQSALAERLGMEASLFMPSGTMTNQVAVRIHCQPGDELICDEGCHIYNYEQGAFAQFSGVVARTIAGRQSIIEVDQLQGLVRPENEHMVRTRLVTLENTHNRGGGRVLPFDKVAAVASWARENQLRLHLDGARLFNACVASGVPAEQWCGLFDSASICFSKGLGAPIGSALAGSKEFIAQARRQRKLFGGAMRQVGVIAAAAQYALDHNVDRLAEDHQTARILADAVKSAPHLRLEPEQVDTNIVIFRVAPEAGTAADFVERLEQRGVRALPFSDVHVRLVTHRHITSEDALAAGAIIAETANTDARRADQALSE